MSKRVTGVCVCFSSAELPENWTDTRETLLEGMVFQLKYLGVTMVEQPKGEELSSAAVKRIVATVRDDAIP